MSCFAGLFGEETTFFVCGQHTPGVWTKSKEWARLGPYTPSKKPAQIRYSAPDFNLPELPANDNVSFVKGCEQLKMPTACCEKINVPCYGSILDEVMKVFEITGVQAAAHKMKVVEIPKYNVDTFVKGKMGGVLNMAAAARKLPGCEESAVQKLEKFAKSFQDLDAATIKNMQDWKNFVAAAGVTGDWQNKLGFADLLGNFGFKQDFADKLRQEKTPVKDKKTGVESMSTWEVEGCRWLSKGLGAYKPVGCLVDAVNLIFAMMNKTPADIEAMKKAPDAEAQIKSVIGDFCKKLRSPGKLTSLWVPKRLLVDCEVDDMLAWCLLHHVNTRQYCQLFGPSLKVLVQLPKDPFSKKLEAKLKGLNGAVFFEDPHSRNISAIKHHWEKIIDAPQGSKK